MCGVHLAGPTLRMPSNPKSGKPCTDATLACWTSCACEYGLLLHTARRLLDEIGEDTRSAGPLGTLRTDVRDAQGTLTTTDGRLSTHHPRRLMEPPPPRPDDPCTEGAPRGPDLGRPFVRRGGGTGRRRLLAWPRVRCRR